MFLHVQNIQTLRVDSLYFFKHLTKCAPFLLKIEEILTLMIKKEQRLELIKIIFITHLSTFSSKLFLTLKIMDFENVGLTKVVHIYVI
jgi:hypothetical protein